MLVVACLLQVAPQRSARRWSEIRFVPLARWPEFSLFLGEYTHLTYKSLMAKDFTHALSSAYQRCGPILKKHKQQYLILREVYKIRIIHLRVNLSIWLSACIYPIYIMIKHVIHIYIYIYIIYLFEKCKVNKSRKRSSNLTFLWQDKISSGHNGTWCDSPKI